MQSKKRFLFVIASLSLLILLTSATPVSKDPLPKERVKAAMTALEAASADGHVSYNELKSVATDLKGTKLTLRERLVLKAFRKKISKNATSNTPNSNGGKSQLVAMLLCFLVGGFGIHRFYLGYTWQGIVQLFTFGGLGIWALIDLVRIILGTLKPKNDEYEKTL